jgi:hypothetical protein
VIGCKFALELRTLDWDKLTFLVEPIATKVLSRGGGSTGSSGVWGFPFAHTKHGSANARKIRITRALFFI